MAVPSGSQTQENRQRKEDEEDEDAHLVAAVGHIRGISTELQARHIPRLVLPRLAGYLKNNEPILSVEHGDKKRLLLPQQRYEQAALIACLPPFWTLGFKV